ncbi:MAG: hypothetical protein V5A39_01170 [Haloarculaceae archaeon]
MSSHKQRPGPVAQSAFRTGILTASIAGLAGVGGLYLAGFLHPILTVYLLLLVFPIYLVLVASVLNAWLGYGKGVTDLRPVYRNKNP